MSVDYISSSGIVILFLILARHFNEGKGACFIADVAATAKVSESLVQNVFDRFKNARLILEVLDETKGYIPARSLETITLDSLITAVDEELIDHHSDAFLSSTELGELFQSLQESQYEKLKDITVRSILSELDKEVSD